MTTRNLKRMVLAIALLPTPASATTRPDPVLTNATVEAMVRGGISSDAIIQAIRNAKKVDFRITEFEYYQLVREGASKESSDHILQAMQQRTADGARAPESPPTSPPPAWIGGSTPPPVAAKLLKLYINPMEGRLDGFIASEIIKQRLRVSVVIDEEQADYELVGFSLRTSDYHAGFVYGGKDKNEGNVRLINLKQKVMAWAGEGGDRSLVTNIWRRGGQRKIAERIVRQMKKDCEAMRIF